MRYRSNVIQLFYIKNRNQTTTITGNFNVGALLFYIKNRNQTTTGRYSGAYVKVLFYIKNRNQTTTRSVSTSLLRHYFTSKIEIKPQPSLVPGANNNIILHQK